jgi:hypothetical protein
MPFIEELNHCVDDLLSKPTQSPQRLNSLADFCTHQLREYGLPDVKGGSSGELKVKGLARRKDWDVAYEFVGKFRLLISLKSMLENIAGAVPNRLDDLMGEAANVQQLAPEIVIGYVLIIDIKNEKIRKEDGSTWSDYFEKAIKSLSVRGAPLWNQGLLEGTWFIRINSSFPKGQRVVTPEKTMTEGQAFFQSMLQKLAQREPAIPFSKPIQPMEPPLPE